MRNAFTRLTDSSSTGYSGSLSAIHTRLYTVYQDTNNRNMIKLGISENGGQGWQIQNLLRTSGGVLAFAVDPRDREQLYIGSIDTEALRILKVAPPQREAIITHCMRIARSTTALIGKPRSTSASAVMGAHRHLPQWGALRLRGAGCSQDGGELGPREIMKVPYRLRVGVKAPH